MAEALSPNIMLDIKRGADPDWIVDIRDKIADQNEADMEALEKGGTIGPTPCDGCSDLLCKYILMREEVKAQAKDLELLVKVLQEHGSDGDYPRAKDFAGMLEVLARDVGTGRIINNRDNREGWAEWLREKAQRVRAALAPARKWVQA